MTKRTGGTKQGEERKRPGLEKGEEGGRRKGEKVEGRKEGNEEVLGRGRR
jgi:hypothetical protein